MKKSSIRSTNDMNACDYVVDIPNLLRASARDGHPKNDDILMTHSSNATVSITQIMKVTCTNIVQTKPLDDSESLGAEGRIAQCPECLDQSDNVRGRGLSLAENRV